MKFILDGDPIAQARHRSVKRKGKTINYDPHAPHKHYTRMKIARFAMNEPRLAYKDFYHVEFTFYFRVPESDSKATKKAKLEGIMTHTQKPDLDNLEKFLLDSMSGVLFSDDKKVVKLKSEKRWAERGYVEVEINGYNHEKKDG